MLEASFGADSPIRTDVDFRLVVTNHVQSTTMRYRHMERVMGHDPTIRGLEGHYYSQLSYTRI